MHFQWTRERAGVALCLVAGAAFALQPLLVKGAFADGASVASVGAIRFTLAAAVLAVLCRRALASTPLRALLPPFLLGLTLYGLETGLFFASLERIDASLASLVICGYPALVVAGAVLLRRERASEASRGSRSPSRSPGSRSCSPAASAERSTRSGSRWRSPPR